MTYLEFHLVFLCPPILGLGLWVYRRQAFDRPQRWGLLFITTIAVVYTTPWDNYLVAQQVWRYGEGRVLALIGFVPIEEYLFFALQSLLTGLWVLGIRGNFGSMESRRFVRRVAYRIGILGYSVLGGIGLLLLQWSTTTYLGLILVWSVPMLLLQWIYGGPWLWDRRRLAAIGVAVPTLYLCIADRLALQWGIWHISPRTTVGLELAGLPVEEALFFLITNVLVVQGLLLAIRELERGWSQSPIRTTWQRLHDRFQEAVTRKSL